MPHSLAARVCAGTCTVVVTALVLLALSGATGFPEVALLTLLSVVAGTLVAALPGRRRPLAPEPRSGVPRGDYARSGH
ncbi:hypothetical protein ACIGXM_23315 [Kitasatospora sp. NPDC052896]|uniref:hypothetical protein n=1 Tax=Kitasatospora sp. NPDC052896 TaxID=3364061 RepID=UPI0037C6DE08